MVSLSPDQPGPLRVHGAHHHQIGPEVVLVANLLDGMVQQPQGPR
jgi:hypothetical protein